MYFMWFVPPPKSLTRLAGKAIGDYQMIKNGDRLLLGVSGGKDSLSLLHVLRHFQRCAPVKFKLGAITIDPCIEGFDPSPLKEYFKALEMPYFYRSQPIAEEAKTRLQGDSFCAYCARMKRGIMYTTARQENYNVLVLAQHLDDLAESFLMSSFFGGRLNTMKANYVIDAGDLSVIRPFIYVRERQTIDFAKHAQLPLVADSCPACFKMPSERAAMKMLLAQQERNYPNLFKSLLHAMRPLLTR
jgi:tRNA 2-thiocytidine biosynthesis protein TtcA